jgi:F-box/leucine-rich repeat protein 2/20
MRLPLLEELEISNNKQLSKDSIDVVGRCCPLLKSLKYGKILDPYYIDYYAYIHRNEEAFAIAETMPGLHHLTIFGTVLGHNGVLAILDGCPLLESLDLSNCKVLSLGRSLENRFFEQIKNAALPWSFSDDDDYY